MKTSLLKSLVFVVTISTLCSPTLAAAANNCNLTLKVKTPSAKSAVLSGVTFSAKQLNALRAHCNVEVKRMSKSDKVAAYAAKLEREEQEMFDFVESQKKQGN